MSTPRLPSVYPDRAMTKHEEISDVLMEEILSNRFRPGERLPSERDLAARFDANRGAVREAMKMVSQLGLVSIEPGGARVAPIEHASLDVIGYMLRRTSTPEPSLVIDIFEAINALVIVAADRVIRQATEDEIRSIRAALRPLIHEEFDEAAHTLARMEFFRVLMMTSGHIVCQLVAKALFEQLIAGMADIRPPTNIDRSAFVELLQDLDDALLQRDRDAARVAITALETVNRAVVFAALNPNEPTPNVVEVSL